MRLHGSLLAKTLTPSRRDRLLSCLVRASANRRYVVLGTTARG